MEKSEQSADFSKTKADEADRFSWEDFEDEAMHREFSFVTDIGDAILEEEDYLAVSTFYVWSAKPKVVSAHLSSEQLLPVDNTTISFISTLCCFENIFNLLSATMPT